MITRSVGRITAALAVAIVISACGDASTAPSTTGEEILAISVAGIGGNAAGIVLRLSGELERIEAANPSLDVAWVADGPATATVAVLGPIAESNGLLMVRRRAGAPALSVQVIDITDHDGVLSLPATARAIVTGGT